MSAISRRAFRRTVGFARVKRRLLWIVLPILFMVLALGGVACYIVSSLSYPGEQVAMVMLPDTDGYVSFNLKPGLTQSLRFRNLLDTFLNAPSANETWQGLLDQIEADWGIDLETEVQPWLGPELAQGTFHAPDAIADEKGPNHFFYIGTTDETATQAVLDKWLQRRAELDGVAQANQTYRDVRITVVNPDDPWDCWAVTGGYGLCCLGNLTRLERTIDLIKDGGPSLWDNPDFQTARANLPGERMGMGYMDVEQFLGFVVEPGIDDPMGEAFYEAVRAYAPGYFGASFTCLEEGFRLDFCSPTPEGLEFAVQDPNPLEAASLVPGTSLAFIGGQNAGTWWLEFLAKRAELAGNSTDWDEWLEDNLNPEAVELEMGIDFEEDVFSWLTGEFAGAVLPQWLGGPGGGPPFLFLFELSDQETAQSKVEEIIDAISSTYVPIDTEPTWVDGIPATMLSWQMEGEPELDWPKGGYLFLDDYLVVASSRQALAAAVAVSGDPSSSLAQSTEFQTLLSSLQADRTGLLYVNGAQTIDFFLSYIAGVGNREIYYADMAAFIEPLASAGGCYHIGANSTTGTIAFHIAETQLPVTAVAINAPDYVGEGHDFTATVDLCMVDDLQSAQYQLHYDPAVLELTDVTSGTLDGYEPPVDSWIVNSPGNVSVAQTMTGPDGASGHGYLARLRFNVTGASGNTSEISLSNGVLLDDESDEILADWLPDTVMVFLGGAISGVVENEAGDPIANVRVSAFDYDGGGWAGSVRPVGDGSYVIPMLGEGSYRVGAWAPGYLGEYYDSAYEWQSGLALPVPVTEPDNTQGVDFVLGAGGAIVGHVYEADCVTPIDGATVRVLEWEALPLQFTANATADGDGEYAIVGLDPGDYRVVAIASGHEAEFYTNTRLFNEAQPVYVGDGQYTQNIDFCLGPGGSISGTVADADSGMPIADVSVVARADDLSAAGVAASDENGDYTVEGLPYADYKVSAPTHVGAWSGDDNYVREWWQEKTNSGDGDIVTVSEGVNPTGIDFTLEVGGSISGIVFDRDTGEPVNDVSCGSIDLDVGWHEFVYRHQERDGGQLSQTAFKSPGDTNWRLFATSVLEIRVAPDPGADTGLQLTNKRSTWAGSPQDHDEMVACVDVDSTEDAGWYGSSIVDAVDQDENIHGNDDYYTSYYEGYFHVGTPGTWQFSTDSDDASEIVIDDEVVACWYGGHGAAGRWEHKLEVRLNSYDTYEWLQSTQGNEDGTYAFEHVPVGSYIVWATAPGYVTQLFDESPSWDRVEEVVVIPPGETAGIDFGLLSQSNAIGMEVRPVYTRAAVGEDFSVDIWVTIADGLSVNFAEAHIDFEPAKLQVGNLTHGETFGNPMEYSWDNGAGMIDYGAGPDFSQEPATEDFLLCSVEFQAVEPTPGMLLTFVYDDTVTPRRVTDAFDEGEAVLDRLAVFDGEVVVVPGTTLQGEVNLQCRPAAPNPSWAIPLTIVVFEPGTDAVAAGPYHAGTDEHGLFSVPDLEQGTCDIGVKGRHTLSRLLGGVTLAGADMSEGFGTLLEGDANDDDYVGGADYSLLYTYYGQDSPEAVEICDFCGDGYVGGQDYSILYTNYGEAGEMPAWPVE